MVEFMACPGCQTRYRLPPGAAGKKVKCQKCSESFEVPASTETPAAAPNGVRATQAPAASMRRNAEELPPERPRRRRRDADASDDERPRRDREDEVEEGPRRRRRREDDDYEEDRPRRRRKAKAANSSLPLIIGGAVAALVLILVGVGVVILTVARARPQVAVAPAQRIEAAPAPLQPIGGQAGDVAIPVAFGADGTFQHTGRLTPQDPLRNRKPYKLYLAPLEQGKGYLFEMMARPGDETFDPVLEVEGPGGQMVAADDDSGANLNARVIFRAPANGTYKIYARSFHISDEPAAFGEYTLELRSDVPVPDNLPPVAVPFKNKVVNVGPGGTPIALPATGFYRHANMLTPADPTFDGRPYKVYLVPMEQGKTYQIDQASKKLDSVLMLLDATDHLVAIDDDGGGNLNSRIRFQAPASATYKIVASCLHPRMQGPIAITVRRLGP